MENMCKDQEKKARSTYTALKLVRNCDGSYDNVLVKVTKYVHADGSESCDLEPLKVVATYKSFPF